MRLCKHTKRLLPWNNDTRNNSYLKIRATTLLDERNKYILACSEQKVFGEIYNACTSRVLHYLALVMKQKLWFILWHIVVYILAFVHNYRLNASKTKAKHLALTKEISCSSKLILAFLKEIGCRPKEEWLFIMLTRFEIAAKYSAALLKVNPWYQLKLVSGPLFRGLKEIKTQCS